MNDFDEEFELVKHQKECATARVNPTDRHSKAKHKISMVKHYLEPEQDWLWDNYKTNCTLINDLCSDLEVALKLLESE